MISLTLGFHCSEFTYTQLQEQYVRIGHLEFILPTNIGSISPD